LNLVSAKLPLSGWVNAIVYAPAANGIVASRHHTKNAAIMALPGSTRWPSCKSELGEIRLPSNVGYFSGAFELHFTQLQHTAA
jgi:hypothetical protein